jgi:hypothetical protein
MKRFLKNTVLLFAFLLAFSCTQDELLTESGLKLKFSLDTVVFDTLFSTVGSVTKSFKVYNTYKQPIEINSIALARGAASDYRMNVNGLKGERASNVKIPAKDSIYIFIEVTIDPMNMNQPFVVEDSIQFNLNGARQNIKCIAWGQDAHFINGHAIQTQTWVNDKPYVIYNSAIVDSGHVLTINPGVRVFGHKNARFLVAGTLIAEGTKDSMIMFRGDRLDFAFPDVKYDELPNQWGGILFLHSSENNRMDYCEVRSAQIGLQVGILEIPGNPDIKLTNCIIDNHSYSGIFAITSKITAENCVISNCGTYNLAAVVGGEYEFYHTTIANYYTYTSRPNASVAVALTNFTDYDKRYEGGLTKAYFGNCIIYGSRSVELGLGDNGSNELNYEFENCFVRIEEEVENIDITDETRFKDVVFSKDPQFVSTQRYEYDFHLDTLSPAKDAGAVSIANRVPIDFDGEDRTADSKPDLGAFERME